jgi:hypothetical protein
LVLNLVNPNPKPIILIQDLSPINPVDPPSYVPSLQFKYNWSLTSELSDSNTKIIIKFNNLVNINQNTNCMCSFSTKLYSTVDNDNIIINMSIPSDNKIIFNPSTGFNYIIPKANTMYNLTGNIYFTTISPIQTFTPLILTVNSSNTLGINKNTTNTFLSIHALLFPN